MNKMKKTFTLCAATFLLSTSASIAFAGPTCTSTPESDWMDIDAAQKAVEEMGYRTKVFKKTDGNCYELYGWNENDQRVEIYFDPITLTVVEEKIDD